MYSPRKNTSQTEFNPLELQSKNNIQKLSLARSDGFNEIVAKKPIPFKRIPYKHKNKNSPFELKLRYFIKTC